MRRYIHTEASAKYTDLHRHIRAHAHTHSLSAGARDHMHGHPPPHRHTKVSSKLSLGVIIQTLSGERKEAREGGQTEQNGSEGELRGN